MNPSLRCPVNGPPATRASRWSAIQRNAGVATNPQKIAEYAPSICAQGGFRAERSLHRDTRFIVAACSGNPTGGGDPGSSGGSSGGDRGSGDASTASSGGSSGSGSGSSSGALRIDRGAAAGGFSVVYRAFHLGLREAFAVKCLNVPPGLSGACERVVMERFALEGRLQSRLAHRGIVRTFGVGSTTAPADGRLVPFVLLEWLEGRTLADEIARRAAKRLQMLPQQFDRSMGAIGPWTDVYSLALTMLETASRPQMDTRRAGRTMVG